jgi:hypothetical protein
VAPAADLAQDQVPVIAAQLIDSARAISG